MPELIWVGKEAVVKHHLEIPYRLLRTDETLSVGDPGQGNLLVEGDNLHALKALLPYYAGKVKCIYIDPPYNTGNEKWVYNDNVSSPEMQKWLRKVVDRDDLSRHDKWLCMMYPRLNLLYQMLAEDGAIFISIDDNELPQLRCIMGEIFGERNLIATVIWEKMFSPKNSARHLSENHDYVLVYAKNADLWRPNLVPRTIRQDERYKNPDNDPRGPWTSGDLSARNYYSLGIYPITCPSGRVVSGPPRGTYWRVSKENFDALNNDGRIWWGQSGNNVPRLKRFLSEVREGVVPETIWPQQEVGHTQEAKKEIVALLPMDATIFITPKPTRLLTRILQLATNSDSLILDSFTGSGTTGHAVMQLNKEDGGNRRFVLVEMEQEISRNITRERLKRVIEGYGDTEGLGGGFRYCTLAEKLTDGKGQIRDTVTFAELARHIYFTETGEPLPENAELSSPLVGVYQDRAVYLLFNGILGDKRVNGGNVLTSPLLKTIPPHDGPRIIYGEGCRMGRERLKKAGITFKQIPYEVEVN